jgi:hypothetical protein
MQNSEGSEKETMRSLVDRHVGDMKLSDQKTQNVEEGLPLV